MDVSTVANSWVQSYLDALMSAGLSAEHVADESEQGAAAGGRPGMADRSICAKYYVSQILSLDEDGIKGAWKRSTSAAMQQDDKDQRMENLSWRVWGMKRRRATVGVALAREHAHMVEEEEEEADLRNLSTMSLADLNKMAPNPIAASFSTRTRNDADEFLKSMGGGGSCSHQAPNTKSFSRLLLPSMGEVTPEGEEDGDPMSCQSSLQDAFSSFMLPPSPGGLRQTSSGRFEELAPFQFERTPRLYIVLISMHGLVRGTSMELGRDPDTGGQVKYVVELAGALGRIPSVLRVDLLTRLVDDPAVGPSYGQPEEAIPPLRAEAGLGGAFIVRLPCGPARTYLRKEELWPHIREFSDRAIAHISNMLAKLQGEAGQQGAELHVVHGHYADAGEAAALVAHTLGVDMVLTGHSLGRNKRDHLVKQGTMSRAEIEQTYRISRRIEGEERALDAAMEVFTSTQEEIEKQWGLYNGYSAELAAALRNRPCKGYHVPDMIVIPPGLDFSSLKVSLPVDPWDLVLGTGAHAPANHSGGGTTPRATPPLGSEVVEAAAEALQTALDQANGSQPGRATKDASEQGGMLSRMSMDRLDRAGGQLTPHGVAPEPAIWKEIGRFLRNPRKPVILALCRADAKKNVSALIHAYGKSKLLREIANLVLILGNRESIDGLSSGSASVMTEVLKLVDAYDLYGSVAYPKHHQQSQVSDIYLLTAATKGVFVNPALQEPFGLTLIEAAAHGVPTVATKHGGPVDIVNTLRNGLLVEPTKHSEIAECLTRIITNPEVWEKFSSSGRTNIVAYSWPSHCLQYLKAITAEKLRPVIMPQHHLRVSHSLSYEDLSQLVSESVMESRTMSMPPVRHGSGFFKELGQGGASQSGGNGSSRHRDSSGGGSSRGGSRRTSQDSMTLDDSLVREIEMVEGGYTVELMFKRRGGYIVFCADDEADLVQVAQLLKVDGGARAAGLLRGMDVPGDGPSDLRSLDIHDGATGFGVVTTLSFKEVVALLGPSRGSGGGGSGPERSRSNGGGGPRMHSTDGSAAKAGGVLDQLDFLVCQAGAQVWHQRNDGEGLVCDDNYEGHIDFRWESYIAKQAVKRLISSPAGWGKQPINKEGLPRLELSKRGGPFHLQVVLTPPAHAAPAPPPPAAGAAVPPAAPELDVEQLLVRLKCKLRKSGLRSNVLATIRKPRAGARGDAAAGGGPPAQLTLHLTPLRVSRALALRYLAHRYNLDLAEFTVVLFSQEDGGAAAAAMSTAAPRQSGDGQVQIRVDGGGLGKAAGSGSLKQQPPSSGNSTLARRASMADLEAAMVVMVGCSDSADLLGGLQRVVVVPGAGSGKAAAAGGAGAGACRFSADLAPYSSSGRIRVLDAPL